MAKKGKTIFVCQECGYESPQWMGQCICGAWNSFVEERILPVDTNPASRGGAAGAAGRGAGRPEPLKKVGTADYDRIDTGIGELNRVLGGGMVRGSLVLISG